MSRAAAGGRAAAPAAAATASSSAAVPPELAFIDPRVHDNELIQQVTARGACGSQRFEALRAMWLQPTERAPPPRSQRQPCMDLDSILDAVEDTPGDPLEPPVPLPVMMQALQVLWEEED